MHNYVDVFVADCGLILGKWNFFREKRSCDGWVKTVDIGRGERMLLHVGYVREPINYIWCFFPLVELRYFSDFRVDIVENLFTDFSEITFCGIYEAACRVVGEVIFVVF